ncbi:hypothetical protein [Actinomadura luteofluorescens]|uniref:hypothetical protein n=1 Tax=Actinomadura luteofluorescens TaxID=46163 RepID=UPI003D90D157
MTPAREVADLLAALYDSVETRESITTYRRVKRGPGREVAVLDFKPHTTRGPGLLAQLGVIAERGPDGRTALGAAVPGGSPGWDADGALTPLTAAAGHESAEPITDAWHIAHEIEADLGALGDELRAAGLTGFLLTDAEDERVGRRIAARLRGLVARARIAADYDAPITTLRDVYCPECGGEMRVRADASSAVWCAGSWTVEGPAPRGEVWPVRQRCGATWPRGAWVALLADAGA